MGCHIIPSLIPVFLVVRKATVLINLYIFLKYICMNGSRLMGCNMVVSRYAIPTGIPSADGLSMGPLGFGAERHIIFVSNSGFSCSEKARKKKQSIEI